MILDIYDFYGCGGGGEDRGKLFVGLRLLVCSVNATGIHALDICLGDYPVLDDCHVCNIISNNQNTFIHILLIIGMNFC